MNVVTLLCCLALAAVGEAQHLYKDPKGNVVIDLSKVNGTESTDTLFLGFSSFSNLKFQIDHLQINGTNGTETSMKCHFTFSSHAQVISVNLTEAGYSVELNGQTHTWTLDKQINKELVTATIDNNKLTYLMGNENTSLSQTFFGDLFFNDFGDKTVLMASSNVKVEGGLCPLMVKISGSNQPDLLKDSDFKSKNSDSTEPNKESWMDWSEWGYAAIFLGFICGIFFGGAVMFFALRCCFAHRAPPKAPVSKKEEASKPKKSKKPKSSKDKSKNKTSKKGKKKGSSSKNKSSKDKTSNNKSKKEKTPSKSKKNKTSKSKKSKRSKKSSRTSKSGFETVSRAA